MSLLQVGQLSIRLGGAPLVQGIDIKLGKGTRTALLGQSGSGKSLTVQAIAGLLPPAAKVTGRIAWPGLQDGMRLGRDVGLVFQDPMSALNPVLSVGEQIAEVLRTHLGLSRAQARKRAGELLHEMDLDPPGQLLDAYPHQLSGGQRQRVAIAAAIAADPPLLILDEPTTALDTVTERRIVERLDALARTRGTALLLVTHDLALAAALSEEALLLASGRLVARQSVKELIARPDGPEAQAFVQAALELRTYG